MTIQLGKYTLEKKIGSGGMADVWLSQGPMGTCVVKAPHPHLCDNPDFVRMFLDEASLLAQLHHPGIAQIYDLGTAKGAYFLAMEYVPGFDLMTISLEHERHGELMGPELCARIVADAAAALHYAHEATGANGQPLHIVHRDVTPHNILLTRQGQVKIIDFGVAKASSTMHRTQAGLVKGKYPYMSPEQITGQVIDCRVDVYALGLVLYELLTNVRAIPGNNEVEQIENARHGRIRPIEQLRPNVPVPLRQILGACLHFEVSGRYPSAQALQQDLEKYLAYEKHVVGQDDLLRLFRVVAADVGETSLDSRPTEAEQPVSNPSGPVVLPTNGAAKIDELGYSQTEPSMKMPALAPLQLGPAQAITSPPGEARPTLPSQARATPAPARPTTDVPVVAPRSKGPILALAGLSIVIIGLVAALMQPGSTPATDGPEPVVDAGAVAADIPDKLERFSFPSEDAGGAAEPLDAGEQASDAPVDAGVPLVAPEPGPPGEAAAIVTVTSVVEGEVIVDGQSYGRTPQELNLPPGQHTIIVRNSGAGLEKKVVWKLKPGETRAFVVPAPGAKPPTPTPAAKGKGRLQVKAFPFCALKVDGKVQSGPPVALWKIELTEGPHTVQCVLEDPSLPKPRVKTRKVTVVADGDDTVEFDMGSE